MGFTVEVAGKTDVGCVRTNNEDNFGYDSRYGIFVVCDGMGGQAAGEVASKMAVDTVLTYYRTSVRSGHFPKVGEQVDGITDRANHLGSSIQLANQAVHDAASAHAAQAGMGSTAVAVSTEGKGSFFSIGHVGDSRIYLVRNGDIQQLTNDHSLVMEQVRRGLDYPGGSARIEDAEHHHSSAGDGSDREGRFGRHDGHARGCVDLVQ